MANPLLSLITRLPGVVRLYRRLRAFAERLRAVEQRIAAMDGRGLVSYH
jgi:hypothetical protein